MKIRKITIAKKNVKHKSKPRLNSSAVGNSVRISSAKILRIVESRLNLKLITRTSCQEALFSLLRGVLI